MRSIISLNPRRSGAARQQPSMMDSKQQPYFPNLKPDTMRVPRMSRRLRSAIFLASSALFACSFFLRNQIIPYGYQTWRGAGKLNYVPISPLDPTETTTYPSGNKSKVALEAHIMSKCFDARDCLRELIVPTMEQVVDMVDFKLSFIGK
jgi:hypothetical protein